MKKRRISYRDWLNRAPQAPAAEVPAPGIPTGELPVAEHPTADALEVLGNPEHAEARPDTEHTDGRPTAEAAAAAQPAAVVDPAKTADAAHPADVVQPAITADTAPSPATPPPVEALEVPPVEHLVFRVGSEFFALPLDDVEETFDVEQVQRIPQMSAAMLGVLTLRGATVPLYAPGVPLGVAAGVPRSALVFVTDRGRVALAVDDVDDVLVISTDDIRRPPLDFGDGVLVGVTRRGADLIGVLAAPALLAACRTDTALEIA